MAVSQSFIERAEELFQPFGDIRVRRMFGGAGLYCDDLFFAILDDGAVFLKADEDSRRAFEDAGLQRFTFEMKDGSSASMSYYAAPDDLFDDEDVLKEWTTRALDAASRAKKRNPKKKKRG